MATQQISPFGQRLRAELTRKQISVRALARRMDAKDPEIPRRLLNRLLNGQTKRPTPESLEAIVVALGDDSRERLDGSDEDDEDSSDMADALLLSLRKIINAELRRIRKGVAVGEKA